MSKKPAISPSSKAVAKPASKVVPPAVLSTGPLLNDLRDLIAEARQQVARTVNTGLVVLYWHVGNRIRRDLLNEKRAGYGKKVFQDVSAKLVAEFGRGWGRRNLEQMVRFAEVFTDFEIAQSLPAQLSWTHLVEIIRIDDPLKREFYTEMCRIENWSTRTLVA